MLDQLEEGRLGPVEVVEDEHERLPARERLAEPPEQPRDLGGGRWGLGLEGSEDRIALFAPRRVPENLAQRPVRDAVAVREAAAPERRDALRAADEFRGEPRLADAGGPDDEGDAR